MHAESTPLNDHEGKPFIAMNFVRPWCLLSRFHFSGCLLIDTIEVEHCDLLMLLLLSCEECGMDNCAWSARIRQQRWRYQRPSVSVLNWPHSPAFDGSLYGNLHLIMNIKKKHLADLQKTVITQSAFPQKPRCSHRPLPELGFFFLATNVSLTRLSLVEIHLKNG